MVSDWLNLSTQSVIANVLEKLTSFTQLPRFSPSFVQNLFHRGQSNSEAKSNLPGGRFYSQFAYFAIGAGVHFEERSRHRIRHPRV